MYLHLMTPEKDDCMRQLNKDQVLYYVSREKN